MERALVTSSKALVSTSFLLLLERHLILVAMHLFLLASCFKYGMKRFVWRWPCVAMASKLRVMASNLMANGIEWRDLGMFELCLSYVL